MAEKVIYVDLDDFDVDDIIEHLNHETITHEQKKRLKQIIRDAEVDLAEEILSQDVLYQKLSKIQDSMVEEMKLEIVLNNISKFSLTEIIDLFENKK